MDVITDNDCELQIIPFVDCLASNFFILFVLTMLLFYCMTDKKSEYSRILFSHFRFRKWGLISLSKSYNYLCQLIAKKGSNLNVWV